MIGCPVDFCSRVQISSAWLKPRMQWRNQCSGTGNQAVSPESMICVEPWPRAVLIGGRAVLMVEKPEKNNVGFDWQLLRREEIRRFEPASDLTR